MAGQRCQQLALYRLTADNHVQRRLHPQYPGKPLCATRAGDQPQLDLGQRNHAAGRSNAVVAAQRRFQPAAHAHRMDGSHHGLGRMLNGQNHAQQMGLLQRLRRIKFLNVRPARKRFTSACKHNGHHLGIGIGLRQPGRNSAAGRQSQTVDRRVVQGDHSDVAVDLVRGVGSRHAYTLELKRSPVAF